MPTARRRYAPGDSLIQCLYDPVRRVDEKSSVSIVQTAQSYTTRYGKSVCHNGNADTGFAWRIIKTRIYRLRSPINPAATTSKSRELDDTYAEFVITIANGLVIHRATVDIAAISGVTAPARGALLSAPLPNEQ
jgi:hypothetical protein